MGGGTSASQQLPCVCCHSAAAQPTASRDQSPLCAELHVPPLCPPAFGGLRGVCVGVGGGNREAGWQSSGRRRTKKKGRWDEQVHIKRLAEIQWRSSLHILLSSSRPLAAASHSPHTSISALRPRPRGRRRHGDHAEAQSPLCRRAPQRRLLSLKGSVRPEIHPRSHSNAPWTHGRRGRGAQSVAELCFTARPGEKVKRWSSYL